MSLIQESNLGDISIWLNENILNNKSIEACCHLTEKVPKSKGLYFWFMKQNGYHLLGKKVQIERQANSFQLEINAEKYDLVYIGSAGTGKQGNSNLRERLHWHICQKHTKSNVCHGTLSTFRTGLSALIAEDLIIPDTEKELNEMLCSYFYVYWIEYTENSNEIDSDEKELIAQIKPIFNIKNNPNTRPSADQNSTQVYRRRRLKVIANSRTGLNCTKESEKIMKETSSPTKDTTLYTEQVICEIKTGNHSCVEYSVLQDQDIAEITRGIPSLYRGRVEIQIFNAKSTNEVFNLWNMSCTGKDDDWGAQNIYSYFSNTCTPRLHHIAKTRNKVISWWMKDKKIEEIIVKVCWDLPVNP